MTQGSPLIMATWPARNSCAVFIRISDGIKDKNRPRIIGSVPVSSQAALLRQVAPGRARDAGNGEPLPSLATPSGATCRATLRAGPVFCAMRRFSSLIWNDQTVLLVPCLAQKQATARLRTKREQTLTNLYKKRPAFPPDRRRQPACASSVPHGAGVPAGVVASRTRLHRCQ